MYPIPAKVLTVAKQYRSKRSEMPDPGWYLEQFRSHVGKIHELFKVCPPQQWKPLSLSIGDVLAEVGEKVGGKAGRYIQIENMSLKEKRYGKGESKLMHVGIYHVVAANCQATSFVKSPGINSNDRSQMPDAPRFRWRSFELTRQ